MGWNKNQCQTPLMMSHASETAMLVLCRCFGFGQKEKHLADCLKLSDK